MRTEQIIRELKTINARIYNLECELKTLDYDQHAESSSKIDYLAMMTDVDIDTGNEEGIDDVI